MFKKDIYIYEITFLFVFIDRFLCLRPYIYIHMYISTYLHIYIEFYNLRESYNSFLRRSNLVQHWLGQGSQRLFIYHFYLIRHIEHIYIYIYTSSSLFSFFFPFSFYALVHFLYDYPTKKGTKMLYKYMYINVSIYTRIIFCISTFLSDQTKT